ncbi:hypothetical protein L226DRAFT_615868 [Lentinus tigrinus ALCF2SS1-7]|uniref:Uncharacterized protein n=1 Tax=Lentinus tigrinus ALCF2SS1-6 TaxID=1328759 RepID=A0A5C2SGC8_9APHY|nr:hypothetical protein L227DRAFT_526174 [Lentinus tigrinus ALCF2SS1-6]RPD70933.1 hypothetical protein L226DRAFT_615868 [Lentinus tigrinus ALCF2SS1-7]
MSTQAQSSSPFSRLSRLAFPFKSNPSSPLSPETQHEDWYIPYNGPYEPPKDDRNTDSWGHLVSGWLMEGEERGPRARAMSNASRPSGDQGSVRKNSRIQAAFIKLDQAGGVGDVPVLARPRRSQEAPVHHRASLASILSFGKQKTRTLQHSPSTGTLRERADSVPSVPQDAVARQESASQPAFPRRHPYAYATPAPPPAPVSSPIVPLPPPRNNTVPKFSVQLLDPLARKPSAPAYLLPARRPSRLSLKASMSTPNLRAATGTGSVLPKGKQRWLSAETWCDALILPRPRFALRVIDGEGGSGRIVSPPGSPIWLPETEPSVEKEKAGVARLKSLKKSQSAIQLSSRPEPPSPPRLVPVKQEPRPEPGPSNIAQPQPIPATMSSNLIPGSTNTHLIPGSTNAHTKPFRPKSWALDDLALPSPVPSLAKVLEDGKKLEADRQAWQRQAAKSFADSRARSVSRARSKSIGARARSHAREPSAFEAIAEVTLLGSQRRRPTVHVRVRPPRSDGHTTSSGGGTTTITGTALGTFTSASHAHSQGKSRSHGHSASLGSISQHRSDESFMWTPGHGRNHSLGKSALRIVRTTATTAAGFCGINGSTSDDEREKGRAAMNEKGAAIEEALRHDGTKIIHLHDQVVRDRGRDGGVVVITPPDSSTSRGGNLDVGPGGSNGVSPTPSGQSISAEGIGIAISSPLPQEDPFEKEPIRIPDHPYAQGASAYPYYDYQPGRAPILPSARATQQGDSAPSPTSTTGGDSVTKHRQPVKVHPYSPYSQVQHPFAAITGTDAGPSSRPPKPRPSKNLDVYSSKSSMFAELSPGTIREIMPDEIQYSPYIPTPPPILPASTGPTTTHPYASSNNRLSEWGFADALSQTLRPRGSVDSGLGTSEAHEIPAIPDRPTFNRELDDSDESVVISPEEEVEEEEVMADMLHPHSRSRSGPRPKLSREATQGSSNHTIASSPMSSINPPAFRTELLALARERSFNSSGSSPGVVSNQSSPPLSPRPINSSDDLERFRDLFYRPPESRTPSSEDTRPPVSRRPSATASIPIELNARSTRSLSGLTTLARQLSANMEEMQDREQELEEADRASPMWGARYGGLSGQRPEDLGPDPPGVLSQSSSRSGYLRDDPQSPLRLPLDDEMVLSQPSDVVPEDVESSRASSMLELPLEEDGSNLRVGEIEAIPTPSAYVQPARFSTHLTQMDYTDNQLSPESPEDERSRRMSRIVSQQSSLAVPLSSDAARSSFMTNTSGMSRLSDFPAPPSQITASHLSILNAYYGDNSRDHLEDADPSRPELVREASQATFGRPQMGEAL